MLVKSMHELKQWEHCNESVLTSAKDYCWNSIKNLLDVLIHQIVYLLYLLLMRTALLLVQGHHRYTIPLSLHDSFIILDLISQAVLLDGEPL